jgi:ribosomal protein S18 acetylase RimI-like enzyme
MNIQISRWDTPTLPHDLLPLLEAARGAGIDWMSHFAPEWQRRPFLDRGEGLFLARRGARLAGMAVVTKDGLVDDPDTGRLRYVFVQPDSRRLGIAEALVSACLREADTRWQRLTLHTDNPVAEALYRRLGFVATGADKRITHERTRQQI